VAVTYGGKDGLILLDQIWTIDKSRLVARLGALDRKTLLATLRILQEVFAQ
jgi:mRNA interferase MazF